MQDWTNEFDSAITICDTDGIITYMNKKAIKTVEKYGGDSVLGKSIYDCHPEHANVIIRKLMQNHEKNVYTIEKNGVKKLIYQAPIFENGEFKGLVEISHVIPFEMPNFIRQ